MPDTPNYEFLKPVLGDELYAQVAGKLGEAQGVTLANVADGSYVAKATYDADIAARDTKVTALTNDLAARDKTIADTRKRGMVVEKLRAEGARNPEMAVRLLDLESVAEKDGKLTGLDDQLKALKASDAYLFAAASGVRAGVMGGATGAVGEAGNQQINDMIRRASGRID